MSNTQYASSLFLDGVVSIANACKNAAVACASGVSKATVSAGRSIMYLITFIYQKTSDRIQTMLDERSILHEEKHEISLRNWEKMRALQTANEAIVRRTHKPFTLPLRSDTELDLLIQEKLSESAVLLFFLPEALQKAISELLEFDPLLCKHKSELEKWRADAVKALDEVTLQQELCNATIATMQNKEYNPEERILLDTETCMELWRNAIQPLFFADRDLGCWHEEMLLDDERSDKEIEQLLECSLDAIFCENKTREQEQSATVHEAQNEARTQHEN